MSPKHSNPLTLNSPNIVITAGQSAAAHRHMPTGEVRDAIGVTGAGRRTVTIAAGIGATATIAGDPSLRQRGMAEHFVS